MVASSRFPVLILLQANPLYVCVFMRILRRKTCGSRNLYLIMERAWSWWFSVSRDVHRIYTPWSLNKKLPTQIDGWKISSFPLVSDIVTFVGCKLPSIVGCFPCLFPWWFCCDKSNVFDLSGALCSSDGNSCGLLSWITKMGESRDRADGCYIGSRKREDWSNMTHVFWDEVLEFAQMNHGAVYDEGCCVLRVAWWGRMILVQMFMMMVLCMMCLMIRMLLFKINHFTCITCIVEMLLLWLEGYLNRLTFAAWWHGCR